MTVDAADAGHYCHHCKCVIRRQGTYDWTCDGKHDRPRCTMRGCVPRRAHQESQ